MDNKEEAVHRPQQQQKEKPKRTCKICLIQNYQVPKLSLKMTSVLCFLVGLIFIGIAIPMFIMISKVQQHSFLYYDPNQKDQCDTGHACVVNMTLQNDLDAPIYVLYQVGNFYQNHRLYLQSKSNYQLAGNKIKSSQAKVCDPYITNQNMNKTTSWNNNLLDPTAIASPCGSIALTHFTDTYKIQNQKSQLVTIRQTGITWPGDKGRKYRKNSDSETTQWVNPEDEHFIVWMQTSGLLNFKKLWGVIEEDLTAGDYQILIDNNYDSEKWEGERHLILTTNSIFGGKNFTIPVFILVSGVFCLLGSVLLIRRRWKILRKKQQEQQQQ